VLREELRISLSPGGELSGQNKEQLLGKPDYSNLVSLGCSNMEAEIASGTAAAQGMIVVPCSMGALARIARGISSNLIERAADVMLKERRPLICCPRETPLNIIHLRNMLHLAQAGAQILPCMPAFYHHPQNLEDLADFIAGRILDGLGLDHKLFSPWQAPDNKQP